MAERESSIPRIPRPTVESTDVKETAKYERKWGKSFVANTAHRHHSSSLACKCKSRIFTRQEFNSCRVLFFIDSQASMCRSSGTLDRDRRRLTLTLLIAEL